jgi:Domain of unknown function (DUF4394)
MTLPEVEMRSVKAGVLALSLFAVGCTDRTSPTSETTGLEGIDGVDETTAPDAAAPSELGSAASTSSGGKVFGVDTENNLVVFNLDRPGRMNRKVRITGIGGQKILGIDFRPSAVAPATAGVIGKLYGITKTKVYEIDPGTGYASNGQSLTVPLVGVSFGTGFNPTVDRLRSHGNATQNVRLSVDNGLATQDTPWLMLSAIPALVPLPASAASRTPTATTILPPVPSSTRSTPGVTRWQCCPRRTAGS